MFNWKYFLWLLNLNPQRNSQGLQYQTNFLAWEPYGVGKFVVFLVVQGIFFFIVLFCYEFRVHKLLLQPFLKARHPNAVIRLASMVKSFFIVLLRYFSHRRPLSRRELTTMFILKLLKSFSHL